MKSKDSKHQDSEKVDMFRDDEFSRAFIKKNIETIVKGLAKQVREPEDSYREVLQNCIDSDTPQIDVYYNEKPAERDDEVKLDMIFEDYGCGMNHFERKEFFLNLFKSNKKYNKRKIGKYGIGISSVFILGIDEFYVESCGMNKKKKEKEPWSLYLWDIKDKPHHIIKDIEERKGTKIVLTKTLKKDDVEAYKAKAKAKMKYFCKRSRTPIYVEKKSVVDKELIVEKEFINEKFDIDSKIKSYKSSDDLEFVLAVTHDPFYELHNHRLLLEENQTKFFKDWGNVSVLISSYDLRHTFERDSVIRDKRFGKITDIVRKEIKTLFSNALERLADYAKNPIPVFKEKCPEITIDRGYIARTIYTIAEASAEVSWIKSYCSSGIIKKEKAETILSKIAEFKKQFYEYSRKKKEFDDVNFDAKNEERLCWDFVVSYMKKMVNRASSKRYASDMPFVGGLFKAKAIAAKTKSELPAAAYEHKIIPTINGHISIGELADAFAKQNTILSLNSYNPELQKLLDEQNELVLFYDRLKSKVPLTQLVDLFGDTENAAYKYIVQCKIEDESIIGEREEEFLKKASKMLKSCYDSSVNEIYFTNHMKLGKDKINKPVILMSQYGRIEIGKSKKKLTKRVMDKTKNIWNCGARYDLALNLDSEKVQKMITVYHSKDKHISNLAFIFLKSEMENDFPWLKASTSNNAFSNPTDYKKFSNAGLGTYRGF